jgi:hypothetical protein
VLQPRPHTFAQTNLSLSFFACDTAADHTFQLARHSGFFSRSVVSLVTVKNGPSEVE